MLSRRRAEGEPDYLREVKNEFMAQWDGIRCGCCPEEGGACPSAFLEWSCPLSSKSSVMKLHVSRKTGGLTSAGTENMP